jgi:thiol:disulfide interchange protein
VIVIIFGLHMTGLIRIRFLEYDLRPQKLPDRKWGYLSSALMGVFFSAGWSPCVGPILGAILTLSASGGSTTQGVQLLSAYSVGLAIPFLLAATQLSLVTHVIRRYGKLMHYVEKGMGVLLILVGIFLFIGRFERLASLGPGFFFGDLDELLIGRVILIVIIAATILGLIPAFIARMKGRNFLDWWFFGAGLFFVALPAALMIKSKEVGENPDLEHSQKMP